jgi:hypothetical protein
MSSSLEVYVLHTRSYRPFVIQGLDVYLFRYEAVATDTDLLLERNVTPPGAKNYSNL